MVTYGIESILVHIAKYVQNFTFIESQFDLEKYANVQNN